MLLAGVYGAFLTGDIFNLYVWFEVMLIASFGLMVLDAGKVQVDGAVKYVVLNLVSTLVFLLAIGLLYGATGTLNLADLHTKAQSMPTETQALLSVLFLFAFAIKSALFPLFSWLPASYHTLPNTVVALFAGLLTKVGVYALIRLFTLVFPLAESGWQPLLIWVAGLTMLTGVLGAAAQFDIKRILSFHIISQIGYMIMGLAIYTPLALAGAIFYIVHHIIVKANLFLIGGFVERRYGSSQLSKLGGVYKSMPLLAFLFIIPAFSLAGFPLIGFLGQVFGH
ncbi:Na(+) H(+) antiporter subunit D [Vibrio maritimus]|uniref:Na(+) H(+) antiporter subunit D n=1 Tax=Vibrio maritimus TaxID=990268 RepID=A0A090RS46_9VIBR|nr:Na(+) H(+) antiporter subunit D [Vibrio maritimus]